VAWAPTIRIFLIFSSPTPPRPHEFVIFPVIIVLVIPVGGQDHANRARGKVVEFAPDHGADIEAVIRAVEVIPLLILAVVNNHIKTAGLGDNQLVKPLVRMPATLGPAGQGNRTKN